MSRRSSLQLLLGILFTSISMYQLLALELAHFYALFSLGFSLILSALFLLLAKRPIFASWSVVRFITFFALLLGISILIDVAGMRLGYWEYPHYDMTDAVRKYLFEWTIALFYHFVAFVVGIEVFRRTGFEPLPAKLLSLLIVVSLVGLLTESMNLRVESWRVKSMPISDVRIGDYFVVFQTIGYWLMALIPYGLYEITRASELDRGKRARQRRPPAQAG